MAESQPISHEILEDRVTLSHGFLDRLVQKVQSGEVQTVGDLRWQYALFYEEHINEAGIDFDLGLTMKQAEKRQKDNLALLASGEPVPEDALDVEDVFSLLEFTFYPEQRPS